MQSDQVIISALAGYIKFKGSTCILHMYVGTVVFKKFQFQFSTRWWEGGGLHHFVNTKGGGLIWKIMQVLESYM